MLTIPFASAKMLTTAMKRTSTRHVLREESPRLGERGREADGEYTLELAPERLKKAQ